jgi:hypothetical protein
MNRDNHQNIKYCKGENAALLKVNEPHFRKLCELGDDWFEIESAKKNIRLDIPIQVQ